TTFLMSQALRQSLAWRLRARRADFLRQLSSQQSARSYPLLPRAQLGSGCEHRFGRGALESFCILAYRFTEQTVLILHGRTWHQENLWKICIVCAAIVRLKADKSPLPSICSRRR